MRHAAWRAWVVWTAVLVVAVAVMLALRPALDKAHVALVLLLVVLGASATGGRALGVSSALASFLVFNWFFVLPYSTLVVANPLDWLVLVAFLVTGIVAAQLLYAARRLAARAAHADALRESERLKDAFLASVSHDLRTPLTAIKALAHDLSVYGDERTEIIEQEADRLNRTVGDLLDLSRLNAGALPLRIELNAVDDLLGALVQRLEPAIGSDRLRISLPPDDPLLLGNFDFVHTLRVVGNLVENAARYSPPASAIEVAARRDGSRLFIEVADRGPGIPADEAPRIFDAFYRPAATPPDTGAAGLGLSIARRLAEAQGGTLEYAPRPEGGSRFVLALPAHDIASERDNSRQSS